MRLVGSSWVSNLSPFFSNGTTFALFHEVGKQESLIERLTTLVKAGRMSLATSLRIYVSMLSSPVDFEFFKLRTISNTSSGLTGLRENWHSLSLITSLNLLSGS